MYIQLDKVLDHHLLSVTYRYLNHKESYRSGIVRDKNFVVLGVHKMPEQLGALKSGDSKEAVNQDDDDSDWEYEYHETEMEVYQSLCKFFLNAGGHLIC